jgi:hypothetical protein
MTGEKSVRARASARTNAAGYPIAVGEVVRRRGNLRAREREGEPKNQWDEQRSNPDNRQLAHSQKRAEMNK